MEKHNSKTKQALLNMIFNFIYQILNTIVNIILPPLIITKFGSVINGLISTIKQILGYVQLIGAGISESTVVSLYKPIANNDHKRISSIFNACSSTFFKMGVLFNISSVILAIIYPFFVGENIDYFFLVGLILVISVAGSSEFYVIGKCRSLLIADQKVYIVNIAQIFGAICNLIVTVTLINLDANILIVQAGASILYAMRLIILYTYVKKNYEFIDRSEPSDFSAISKRKAATVHQLSGLISFGSQTIVVSIFCGLAEASVYSVYNLVFTGINTILSTISSALLASFGHIIAENDSAKLKKIFSVYESFYFILVFLLYTVTYIMFLSFISIYTKGTTDAIYLRPTFAALFCLMGIVNCLRTPGATLINAIGHYRETQNRAVIEMIICFVMEILLVILIGVEGVIIGTIIAYLYRSIDVVYYSNRVILKQSFKSTLVKLSLNIFVCIIVVFISFYINISATTYLEWIMSAALVFVVLAVVFGGLNYLVSKEEYKYIYTKFILRR